MWTRLYADDSLQSWWLSEKDLQKVASEFNKECTRKKLKVSVKKSKVMVLRGGMKYKTWFTV